MANEITIKVKGIPEALASLRKYQSKKKEQIKHELRKGAFKVEGLAKDVVAVDSGRLKSSITTDDSDIGILLMRVGTNVFYAVYVEFGTKRMPARPYLFPAFFAYENDIVKAIGRVLRKDIGIK